MTTDPQNSKKAVTSETPSRWDIPALVFFAGGILGITQTVFLLWRYQAMAGASSIFRQLSALGYLVGILTALLLLIPAALLRRFAQRPDLSRSQATGRILIALVAALSGWIYADRILAFLTPTSITFLLCKLLVAAFLLFIALRLPPPRLIVLRSGAALSFTLSIAMLMIMATSGKESSATEKASKQNRPRPGSPDVVLISIDTLRADRLGIYGREPSLTPNIDRLAGEGVWFSRVSSASSWTVPSVASLLTGLPALRHRTGRPVAPGPTVQRTPLAGDLTTLAESFFEAGYRTRAVVANVFLSEEMGFQQGFQEYENPLMGMVQAGLFLEMPLTRLIVRALPPDHWGDPRAEGITKIALNWLREADSRPLFLWVHYIDPHAPFQADPSTLEVGSLIDEISKSPKLQEDGTVVGKHFGAAHKVRSGEIWLGTRDRELIEEYYDTAVAYLDTQLEPLFSELRKRRESRPTIVALTADHGEEFWDHGNFEHGHDYYHEITHIPLIFWGSEKIPVGSRITKVAGLVDVAPTLLRLADLVPSIEPTTLDEGRSLINDWQPVEEEAPDSTQTLESSFETSPPRFSEGNLYGLPAVMVEDGQWRFILRANKTEELYDTLEDPTERNNLAMIYPEIAAKYHDLLMPRLIDSLQFSDSDQTDYQLETMKGLKALGYVQ